MFELLFDPMFRVPFVTGLLLAPLAAIVGVYLRLRGEWLAALAYAQIAAVGGLLAVMVHGPVMLGAVLGAGAVAVGKGLLRRAGNDHFAVLMVVGWGLAVELASLSAHGEMLGHSLIDGQLYFVGHTQLVFTISVLLIGVLSFRWLSRRLLLARFFPDTFSGNNQADWPHHLVFDVLAVTTVAVATTTFGVMAAFALTLVPAWIAWGLARGWKMTLIVAASLALGIYVMAFVAAILLDQPFGPVLAILLGIASGLRLLASR